MESIKIPKSLHSISPKNARLYAAYLDLKLFNPEGVIKMPIKRKADRFYYRYWLNRLCDAGWVRRISPIEFHLKTYQEVWGLLGVNRSFHHKIKKYKYDYHKIDIENLSLDRKVYFQELVKKVLSKVAGNKTRQIRWKLKQMQGPGRATPTETFLSCRSVAGLFGLRSATSGSKYREKYFSVYDDPLVLRKLADGTYRYRCGRIAI